MDKEVFKVKILSNEKIAEGVYQMTLESMEVALSAKPGQFVNVYLEGKDTLLPRPISICWTDGAQVVLVYGVVGKGTQEMADHQAGEWLKISSPLGNGYDLSGFSAVDQTIEGAKVQKALLVGGGIGVPPLLELTYELTKKGVEVVVVAGFQQEPFLAKPLIKAGADLYLATDSGDAGFHGNVVELIQHVGITADAYFACGPKAMLRALSEHCQSVGADVQVSLEERMGCGYGACVGCAVKTKSGDGSVLQKKVCTDGPVFWGSEVTWGE